MTLRSASEKFMRTRSDRLRHAVSFELIGLALITPLGAWMFDFPLYRIGSLAVVGTLIAGAWTYLFNWGFDHALNRWSGSPRKSPVLRVGHAMLFEAGLLLILVPYIAWHLDIGLWQALVMDLTFAGFYLVYALAFNWLYDILFPIPTATAPVRAS